MEGRSNIAASMVSWLAAALTLTACAKGPDEPPPENLGEARSAAFSNGDFESGSASTAPPGWTVTPYLNPGVTVTSPQTRAGLNLATGGSALTYTLVTTAGPESQTDPSLGSGASLRWPKYGNKVAIVNQLGKNQNTNSLKQAMTIAASDIDSADGLVHVRFVVAPVLENPSHSQAQQPYYFVQLNNVTRNAILYNEYDAAAQAGVPWKTSNGYYYTDWQLVDIAPGSAKLAVGDQVELEIIGAGCSLGGHFGEMYVDSVGAIIPGPFVTATGPASANANSNITYKLAYKNGGTGAVGNATVELNIPTNTTFVSVTAPGLTCTTPAVGATGLVSCVIGTLAAGASGNFSITVHINSGVTGTITAGNYDIYGTAISPLLGPKVLTTVTTAATYADLGISISNGTSSLVWGQPVTYTIVAGNQGPSAVTGATVSNPIPANLTGVTWTCVGTGGGACAASGSGAINDSTVALPVGAKVTYTVKGTVAGGTGSGTLQDIATVSVPSGVTDPSTADNSAGDNDVILSANGSTCTTNADCGSGVCDAADHKCGYANGDGPCTAANAGTVCRSSACSATSGVCVPAGGCSVDADCAGGTWCQTSTFTCVPVLANGQPIPTVAGHSPALTGACTAAAAAVVCGSGVCDAKDNACGYLNGDGTCTAQSAATVCRSGVCDPDGVCGLSNGIGTCTAQSAATVCRSGVCDPDGMCGLLNGDGTCTAQSAATVCRSGVCDPADGKCGLLNGDGACTAQSATTVCRSGVCDPADARCGLANGDATCTAASAGTVCRSGACSSSGACMPAGGCNVDGDCASGAWCNVSTHACLPKIANGGAMPSDAGHVSPKLNGGCGTAAAALVCVSGVCDQDNRCGYANGDGACTTASAGTVCRSGVCDPDGACGLSNADGPCTAANAATVCRSGVCDGDGMCGYVNGDGACSASTAGTVCRSGVCDPDGACGYGNSDGACTAQNAGLVCRSGACSANGTCEPTGGCNVDGDCAQSAWCNISAHACQPRVANGGAMPTDTGHPSPTLNGLCSATAAALVCVSGVCDPADNACGYATGDGPCTTANAGTVCRSGACGGSSNECTPAGGCGVDADCATGNWCQTPTLTCAPKLPNGQPIPTVAGHTPALTGACTASAAAAVCASGTCDPADNRCGYANGNGACTAESAATVCRSGVCDPDGKCGLANGDGACTAQNAVTVCRSGACDPDGKCGLANGDGACTAQNAASVCRSGICDLADGKCGLANGDGACTTAGAASICRSGVCDPADTKCGLANGDGACTAQNAASTCRSGACSVSGTCEPSGGCNVDGDCAAGTWCSIGSHTCVPKIANGGAMPTDGAHQSPTLNGLCTPAAGTLVCTSGVCDTKDDDCGLASGDGPCTAANAATVCRSGACGGSSNVCVPMSGCTVDADCASTQWCQTPSFTCAPRLSNGQPIPTVAGHAPALAGTCTAGAGAAVCASGVCDPADNACGYDNEDGACTAANAATVCRSGVCDPDGRCGLANGDGACTLANAATVCRSGACDPDGNCGLANGDGACTLANAGAVCRGGACDPADSKCGYANGDGACTAANAATVCRSGVCDPDGNCGLADGDGACTAANAGTVCRSGECSVSGTCKPGGGCNVDGDCAAGTWCNVSAHACQAKIANGGAMPTDGGHTSPTLNGLCGAAAAALVCTSGVCDSKDNQCGYAGGDGTCTAQNAGTVCRSGSCSVASAVCIPMGGCSIDADCASTQWCQTPTLTCTPKISNGGPIPTVPGHTPTLTGACTTSAAAAVCESGVCDPGDNKCGAANGDGACTAQNAGTVCRSGLCDADGKCGLANGDGACTAQNAATVCRSGACDADGKCGLANGDGACTAQNATTICRSGACDPTDNKCGYANGDGACTTANAGTVCRSGACDPLDGACGLANGDGPCSASNAGLVCRSGTCSVNGTCEAPSGCNDDGDCPTGTWCNVSAHVCAPQIANGGVLPTDSGHTSPTLNGACTAAAGALTCVSGVCDAADGKCGYANGDGACTAPNAATVCRSSVCDPDGKCGYANGDGPCTPGSAAAVCRSSACSISGAVCAPPGGCAVDADCGVSEWCNTQSFSCTPKLPNGAPIPTVPGHTPALSGTCTAGAATAVCAAGLCDATDNLCGYADDDGPCTEANAAVVCRSGSCSATGACKPAAACEVDADCDQATTFCDTGAQKCSLKRLNGEAMPVVQGHQPALDGVCSTTEASIACQSGLCDAADNRCGYANGDGSCTAANAGQVCRSSTCSPHGGVCMPSGGCVVDADCDPGAWCNTTSFSCAPKLLNGSAIPKVAGHTPALSGTCTAAVATAVCLSGVCDTADNACGYADGDGPCTGTTGPQLCRSGACSTTDVCETAGTCLADADCNAATQYCDTALHACALKLPNGAALPAVAQHQPTLDGACSETAAAIVCQSGVCDTADNACGHALGQGPCTAAGAAVVCRAGVCAVAGSNAGTCVECVTSADCMGSLKVCDPQKNACVQCTPAEASACAGATPVCAPAMDVCAPCGGDLGDTATNPCPTAGAPYCSLAGASMGQCGKCATDADCAGHAAGSICDPTTGACGQSCHSDADCDASSWCNAPASGSGTCTPKLDNGAALPQSPASVAKCTPAVGARVCKSGACDAADDKCGYANGDGPCTQDLVCRSGACDTHDQKCGLLPGDGSCQTDAACRNGHCDATTHTCSTSSSSSGCQADADCPGGDFCKPDGSCAPKLPSGSTCSSAKECQSGACNGNVCDRFFPAGHGLLCAAPSAPLPDEGMGPLLLGLALVTARLARGRRR